MISKRICICMSTYNGEKFLEKQLDSILNQTYKDWVLLIHDDGSTDRTLSIIESYSQADPRIQLHSQNHLGIKRAFMTLLEDVDCGYYAFSDQDDMWHADKLATLVSLIDEQAEDLPTLAYSDYQEIDATDKDITNYGIHRSFSTEYKRFLVTNTVTGCTVMINRSLRDLLISKLSDIDYDLMYMHDWWAALVASAFGKVVFCPQRLISYRQHANNTIGATKQTTRWTKFQRIARLKDRYLLHFIQQQVQLFVKLYGQDLNSSQLKDAEIIANLFEEWHPLKKNQQLTHHALKINSKQYDLQTTLLLWVPTALRKRKLV